MLNLSGPEFDFGRVVYAVLEECEHRRSGFTLDHFDKQVADTAAEKLEQIHAAYVEAGGANAYWEDVKREVMTTALPAYAMPAADMTRLERNGFDVFRKGDLAARGMLALGGLILGSIIVAMPWIPIMEDAFAFLLTAAGFFYPDLVRFMYERRHARLLNEIITDAEKYQETEKLRYMTNAELFGSLDEEQKKLDASSPSSTPVAPKKHETEKQ